MSGHATLDVSLPMSRSRSLPLLLLSVLILSGCSRLDRHDAEMVDQGMRAAGPFLREYDQHETEACANRDADHWPGLTLSNGIVTNSDVLHEIGGYAAGTTGGLGGRLRMVSDTRDYNPREHQKPIPGTLRSIVDDATQNKVPVWIVFSPALGSNVTIHLTRDIYLPSNVTVDGTCSGITLLAPSEVGLLNVFSVSNVIIERVRFAKTDYVSSANEGNTRSAIRANGSFDRIAVLHNDLARCGDGCIDITTSPGAPLPSLARISVEYNLITDHDKSMLFGNFTCGDIGVPPCDAAYLREHADAAPVFLLTLNGNLFLRTSQRHPRVFGYAMADIVNNVMALAPLRRTDGSYSDLSGVFVADAGRAWVEQNLFIPLWKSLRPWERFQGVWTTSTPGAEKMPDDVEGFIRLVRNTVTEPSLMTENQPGRVSFPTDRNDLTVLPFDRMPPSQVVACVAARAGVRGSTAWNPILCKPQGHTCAQPNPIPSHCSIGGLPSRPAVNRSGSSHFRTANPQRSAPRLASLRCHSPSESAHAPLLSVAPACPLPQRRYSPSSTDRLAAHARPYPDPHLAGSHS